MGQIVGAKAKPKRANLNALSQVGTPALGEYVLVSSDNSMNAAGQGNFDSYIVGDGITQASELERKNVEDVASQIKDILPDEVFDIVSTYTPVDIITKSMCTSAGVIKANDERCRTDYIGIDTCRTITNKGVTPYYGRFFDENKTFVGSISTATLTTESPDESVDSWLSTYPNLAYVIFVCIYDEATTETDKLFYYTSSKEVLSTPLDNIFVKEEQIIPQQALSYEFFKEKLHFTAGKTCYNNGTIKDASDRCISDYIDIRSYTEIDNCGNAYYLRIFDSSKVFLGNGDFTGMSSEKPSIAHIKSLFAKAAYVIFVCEYTSGTDVDGLFTAKGLYSKEQGEYDSSVLFEEVFKKRSKEAKTVYLSMYYGRMSNESGTTYCLDTDSDYVNYIRSSRFVRKEDVFGVNIDSGYTLSIYCYNDNFTYIGVVSNMSDIPNECTYLKFELYNPDGVQNLLALSIEAPTDFCEIYDTGTPLYETYFPFPVKLPTPSISNTSDYNGYTQQIWDNGYVVLPPNYNPTGKPYQLVICVHGSNGWVDFAGGESVGKNGASSIRCKRFVAKDGYIVAGCCGFSSLYKDYETSIDDNCSPVSVACYCGLYEYVAKNFNVRQDGCYIYGKSSGGLVPTLLSCIEPFKIRAAAGLSPVVSNLSDLCRASDGNTASYTLMTFGYDFTGTTYPDGTWPSQSFIYGQVEKITGYEPMISNTNIPIKELSMRLMSLNYGDAFDTYSKTQPVPIKFWYAADDLGGIPTQVPLYKELVDRGNGVCKVRVFPSGGHNVTDHSSITCQYFTREAGTITMQTAFAEMLDWFKMW